MEQALPHAFKKMGEKVNPATFKKGIIMVIYPQTATADVQVVGSISTVLKNIPLSSAITAADVMAGDRCRIDMFDESNPTDSVVAYTYGRVKSTAKIVNSGFSSLLGDGSQHSFKHGLSGTPNLVSLSSPVFGGGTGSSAKNFYISAMPDDTYIYYTGSSGIGTSDVYWAAAII